MVTIHLFIHPFVDGAMLKCNVRAHPRIVAPIRIFPLAPARDTVLYCALACLARACATWSSVLNWGVYARSRATVVNLCDYITNQLLSSIPQKLNLGGTLHTTNYALWPLRLSITLIIVSTIAVLVDPTRMAEADAVLMMMYGSLSALVGAYFGFSGVAYKK